MRTRLRSTSVSTVFGFANIAKRTGFLLLLIEENPGLLGERLWALNLQLRSRNSGIVGLQKPIARIERCWRFSGLPARSSGSSSPA